MAFLDVATLGVIISVIGWGINRIEGVRGKNSELQNQICHNNGRIEILEADFSSKLDIVIFRLRVLEERINQNN
ncbi:MAG: hypothetical protein HC903_08260 [Methylacidiphilales bacterium]|nr:hypothetical protein [Candidatus Methylacidiphilales bacterium]NJR15711.1 hypothetical protein [Calothrix sp. CSU_2_0]